ncbi:MAG: redoxin family protein [Myxococcales bacterium]|nr:redoxin family protein [Myxococcales bacterium]MCB9530919.1 redoxin family protein [Myxococcales bacterium]
MGRLFVVAGAVVALTTACEPRGEAPAHEATVERAVMVAPAQETASLGPLFDRLCDVQYPSGGGPVFASPTAAPAPPAPIAGRWMWFNVWATWCAPCVREFSALRAELVGSAADLVMVSADSDVASVESFRVERGVAEPMPVLASVGDVATLAHAVGLAGDGALPMHVLVDGEGHVRCVRTGEVTSTDVRDFMAAIGAAAPRRIR